MAPPSWLWRALRLRPLQAGKRCTLRVLGPALLALLGACAPGGGEERLQTYADRLQRPLDTQGASSPLQGVPIPPRAEALQIPLAGSDLDGLDFLRLRGCALQNTVARRNSSLGRLAPPSQRLLLELAFLRDAPACIRVQEEKGNAELARLLAEALGQKRAQLPARLFNATLGSREYRDFWRSNSGLGAYPETAGSQVVTALEQITGSAKSWLGGDFQADGAALELALGAIAQGDGGELIAALELQARTLDMLNDAIDRTIQAGPLCTPALRPANAPILRTVVQKFFIGGVQPWAADVNQRYHLLLKPIRRLEALLAEALPPAYGTWRDARDAALDQTRSAPATHVRRLQALLGPCYAEFARDT